jgi:hypothetical protein
MKSRQKILTSRSILCLVEVCLTISACAGWQPSRPASVSSTAFISTVTLPSQSTSTFTAVPTSTPKPEAGFQINGKPFKFLGAYIPGWYWGQWKASDDVALITQARQAGITVFHLMPPLYDNPIGTVHENELRHLDHFMDVADKNGLYVMFLLTSGLALSRQNDLPFSNPDGFAAVIQRPKLRQAYKDMVKLLVTRVNTVNGRKYSDDPAILAWMLVEEFVSAPFNYPNGFPHITTDEIADWVQENAAYIKSLDSHHMVCISTTAVLDTFDQMGQDWTPIFKAPALDFVEIEDAEARARDHPDWMHVFDVLFSLDKPVVVMLAYDNDAVKNPNVCTDYQWQADATRQMTDIYLAKGAAGFTINYWRANTYTQPAGMHQDDCFGYNVDNKVILQALLDVSAKLGSLNTPPSPLDFVGLNH